jgi:hypothetical protein
MPLRFTSRPPSLRVQISPRHPGASPSPLVLIEAVSLLIASELEEDVKSAG